MKQLGSTFSLAVLLAAVLGGAVGSASAAPLFLNNTITARIPVKDLPSFRSAVGQVLNHAADGSTTQWRSSEDRSHHVVNVSLTPLQTTHTQKANTCRLLDAKVSQLQAAENWQFWFCKQDDGVWKASGSQLPR